jgi:hypothetical protein
MILILDMICCHPITQLLTFLFYFFIKQKITKPYKWVGLWSLVLCFKKIKNNNNNNNYATNYLWMAKYYFSINSHIKLVSFKALSDPITQPIRVIDRIGSQ